MIRSIRRKEIHKDEDIILTLADTYLYIIIMKLRKIALLFERFTKTSLFKETL